MAEKDKTMTVGELLQMREEIILKGDFLKRKATCFKDALKALNDTNVQLVDFDNRWVILKAEKSE